MGAKVKVTRNYQVTIPAEVRAALGIKEGDYVEFEVREGYAVLRLAGRRWTTLRLGRRVSVEEIEELADRAFRG
ncbi:MAG: AbrB/MazE/SpoVT family DNA-binding domain-containing protein [Infirmifilum sp.]